MDTQKSKLVSSIHKAHEVWTGHSTQDNSARYHITESIYTRIAPFGPVSKYRLHPKAGI